MIPRPWDRPIGSRPVRLLTALDFDDEEPGVPRARTTGAAPASPFDLLTGPSTYWAGNLNVFVGGTGRRAAHGQGLHIVPGRTNAAMFIVGTGPDSYRFDLIGLGPDWDAADLRSDAAPSLSRGLQDGAAIDRRVVDHAALALDVVLALQPPVELPRGECRGPRHAAVDWRKQP